MINYLNPSQKVNAKFVTLHGSIACCENELDVRTPYGKGILRRALLSSHSRSYEQQRSLPDHEGREEESVLASPDFMFTEDLEMLKQENVSGDIALRFFDHDGQECNTTLKERMISISMEQFKKIDRKISLVSGVSKANAVLSALKGGLVDVLILDSNLAEALLKLTQE